MSAPDVDQKVMDRFTAVAREAHTTIVLGAGASAPSGLPTWNEFAVRLATLSGLVATSDAAEVLLNKQDPTIVLEAAHARSGGRWTEFLNSALYGDPPCKADPSPLHLAAAGHYAATPDRTTLATLNFDGLLESALLATGARVVRLDPVGIRDPDIPTVHHLHGAVHRGYELSAVVGYSDFAELVADSKAWQRGFLSSALGRGTLLLAGTSYRDPDVRHWLHVIMRDEKPRFPALVTIVREGLGLDSDTFDAISEALVLEWQSIGLQALTLQDLSDVALVIRELRHVGKSSYLPPATRARRVWEAHSRRFEALQREYVAQLEEDTNVVGRAVGGRVQRATFWLATGQRKLARWASVGTHYASIRYLKQVPTGHDSPWTAGEAIGSEEVKIKDVQRTKGVSPTWQSVLAIPVFAGDGEHPEFATGVLTFGLSQPAAKLARQGDWADVVSELSAAWAARISKVAFAS